MRPSATLPSFRSDLFWDVQLEAFHTVLAVEMGLRDLTLVTEIARAQSHYSS